MPTRRERSKLLNRVKRIQGQMEKVNTTLADNDNSTEVLMLLAAVRGGVNALMHEVLEDYIRLHLLEGGGMPPSPEFAEKLIDLVRAYLK